MALFECRLKKYRQLKELTQEQLAAQVGCAGKPSCGWKRRSTTPL